MPTETQPKHTPGPWEVSFESVNPEWAVVTSVGGNIVANVNSETGPDLPPLVSTKMPRDANARLIAAAPDLLEACKTLLEAYCAERAKLPPGEISQADAAEAVRIKRAARAAIAKAEAAP